MKLCDGRDGIRTNLGVLTCAAGDAPAVLDFRAITRCPTPALDGRAFACKQCSHVHFAYHSCNHKACPQRGALSAHRWVRREVRKLINAPYFIIGVSTGLRKSPSEVP